MTRAHQSGQRGYTLMELVVVLALVAVAAALVMPSVTRSFANLELRLAAGSLSNFYAQARTHAIYEARSYSVLRSPEPEAPQTLLLVRDDGKTIQSLTLPAQVQLKLEQSRDAWTRDLPPLHFFPNGTSQRARLELTNQRGSRVDITLDPLTARARVSPLYLRDEVVE
ncbi:MAG TPA: prepilin-type N-terminal cleavage/methylation domain-containing protein [Terriglobales bacterium]|nr:prepilin-type N-terminal cleavage/methylation domain-containing protein [Terriglobales bacterium]